MTCSGCENPGMVKAGVQRAYLLARCRCQQAHASTAHASVRPLLITLTISENATQGTKPSSRFHHYSRSRRQNWPWRPAFANSCAALPR